MSQREAELIEQAKQGDSAAFRELYEQNYSRIFSYIYRRVSNQHLAEDLAGDVFVRLVTKIDTYEHRGQPLLAWLYTVAGNLVRDHHRKNSRVQWMPLNEREEGSDPRPDSVADLMLTSDVLAQAVNELTEEQAQVILLKFAEGMSNAEVAKIMGKREGSIKSLQHRALRSLRRLLDSNDSVKGSLDTE